MADIAATKIAHTIVLDSGPIITNNPPISSLLKSCDSIVTTPAVIAEIRDAETRHRLETTFMPFVDQRNPSAASFNTVSKFALKTGDAAVLSRVDLLVAALAYEIECERNKGDWRLRRHPGQKGINGKAPEQSSPAPSEKAATSPELCTEDTPDSPQGHRDPDHRIVSQPDTCGGDGGMLQAESEIEKSRPAAATPLNDCDSNIASIGSLMIDNQPAAEDSLPDLSSPPASMESDSSNDEASGWITPSNLSKKTRSVRPQPDPAGSEHQMQVTTITGDYALQNLLLQMNLNLTSPQLQRVEHVKTWILRCHACFKVTKDTSKQFCPSCGGATLTRVSCSTSQRGEFKIHLKRDWQYNSRGDRFSIPKPISGSASGRRLEGGGKNHWGSSLLLREDQKEYVRARKDTERENRQLARDMFDQDCLPDILTGKRTSGPNGVKLGAGRNVNARRQR